MSPAGISPLSSAGPSPALLAAARRADFGAPGARPAPEDVQRAAKQFEAILVRQLLAPAIEPMMANSLGGSGSGGGVYGYMLTDALASSITQGAGLGLSAVVQSQLSPRASSVPASASHE